MPARSLERRREIVREWKKKNPEKVREQKRRYRARRKDEVRFNDIACDAIKSLERKNEVKYNQEKILRKLFRARIVLTDFRRPAKIREYNREYNREWRKKNPEKVREHKRRYRARCRAKRCEVRNADMYDPEEILRGLFTDCPRTSSSSPPFPLRAVTQRALRSSITMTTSNKSAITYASTTTTADKSTSTTTASLPSPFPLRAVTLRSLPQRALPSSTNTTTAAYKSTNTTITTTATLPASPPPQRRGRRLSYSSSDSDSEPDEGLVVELERMLAEPEDPPPQRRGRRLSYSSSSDSDSEPDEGLVAELERMLAEPEDPVKRRLSEIRKNRRVAEENRVKRVRKEQEMEKMIVEIASELDEMSSMLHDMGRWFAQFEREDTVEQNRCHFSVTVELMDQLEHYLFSS